MAVFNGNANSSVAKGKQNTIQESTMFRNLVQTDHGTFLSTEGNKIGFQQPSDKESREFMLPKYSSKGDAHSISNFDNVFQQIGGSNLNEKQFMLAENASSHKKDDWYEIIQYKSPSNFTIQNKSIQREKEMFQKHLNELAPQWANEKNPKKDTVYVVKYDGKWTRVKLGDNLDTNSNGKWLRMVDDSGCFKVSTLR